MFPTIYSLPHIKHVPIVPWIVLSFGVIVFLYTDIGVLAIIFDWPKVRQIYNHPIEMLYKVLNRKIGHKKHRKHKK